MKITGRHDQANRQLTAANGTAIDWYFSDMASLNAVKALFNGVVSGINFIYQAAK